MSRGTTANGAHTPEDLEALLEDTLLLSDVEALAMLFEEGAAFVIGGQTPVRGSQKIARRALAEWCGESGYVANVRHPVLAHDIGLFVADDGVNVMRRGHDGIWRYLLCYLPAGF